MVFCVSLVAMGLTACSAKRYRESADREVYGILQAKQRAALGKTNAFTIDTPYSSREPGVIRPDEIIRDREGKTSLRLGLPEALALAVRNNRGYQSRKESLYLSALALTRDRHDFRPKFFANASSRADRDASGERSSRLGSRAGFNRALTSGAQLGVSIANDVLRYYTGDPRRSAVSSLSFDLVQPLLRGAGRRVAAENLTQSERNVIYEIRGFSRFQGTFAIDVVSAYYRLLQQKDTVRNEYTNFNNLVLARDRAEALSVDRFSKIQVDQARQDELSARNRYLLAIQGFQSQVDQFKATLALPLGAGLAFEDTDLEDLIRLGASELAVDEEASYRVAVEHRLDLVNEIDRFEDSQRKILVAADRFKPDLNLFADAGLRSDGPTDYAGFDLDRYRAGAGLELNLPLDRLPERNNYRAAVIAFERQLRTLAQALDEVRSNVRASLRNLRQAWQSYQIQQSAVQLASTRVDSATVLLQAGRVQIRDLLEAQSALVQARNSATQTLVDYHVARLRFLVDIGLLDAGEDRFWLKPSRVPGLAPDAPQPSETPVTPGDVPLPNDIFDR